MHNMKHRALTLDNGSIAGESFLVVSEPFVSEMLSTLALLDRLRMSLDGKFLAACDIAFSNQYTKYSIEH